jgi:integrase/recombinase XerD
MSEYRKKLKIDKSSEQILFLNRRGRKLSRVMIFTIIKSLATKINLEKSISPHTFRHSFASALVQGGADLRAVQEMLGHESILTTEIYTHLDKEFLKETVSKFHPRS